MDSERRRATHPKPPPIHCAALDAPNYSQLFSRPFLIQCAAIFHALACMRIPSLNQQARRSMAPLKRRAAATATTMAASKFPAFLAFFGGAYLTGYFAVFRRWRAQDRPEAASCFTSLFHGTPAVWLALNAVLAEPMFSLEHNSGAANLALDFSTAYFVIDLLHYAVFLPREYLFIAHHTASLFVLATCRAVALHGAVPILVIVAIAEATSPTENFWLLSGITMRAGSGGAAAAEDYRTLYLWFLIHYTIMRGLLAPAFFCRMSKFFAVSAAGNVIPRWLSTAWLAIIGAGIALSIAWVSGLWFEFFHSQQR